MTLQETIQDAVKFYEGADDLDAQGFLSLDQMRELLGVYKQLAEAKALCREARENFCEICGEGCGTTDPCDLCVRLRAMGGE